MKNIYFLLMLVLFLPFNAQSQSFKFVQNDPFGIQLISPVDSSHLPIKFVFKDLDNDDDLDLLLMGFYWENDTSRYVKDLRYFIEMQENIGTPWAPNFSVRKTYYDSLIFPNGKSYFLPAIGDLNGDGLQDFIICNEVDSFGMQYPLYYQQNNDQSFDIARLTQWNLDPFNPLCFFIPEFVDLDRDGDLDIMMSGYYPPFGSSDKNDNLFIYAKNIGTPTEPDFLGWFTNPYGIVPESFPILLTGGDLDLDGDVDFLGLSTKDAAGIIYFENYTDANGRSHFTSATKTPRGLPIAKNDETFFFPSLTDIDGDGDIDVFIPITNDTALFLAYHENELCSQESSDLEMTICQGDTFHLEGQSFTKPGDYKITKTGTFGCQELINLTLEVIEVKPTYLADTLCTGDVYIVAGQELKESGHYELNLPSQSGCDSTIILELTFIDLDVTITADGPKLMAPINTNYEYQWYDCINKMEIEGENSASFEATKSGEYALIIADNIGCVDTSECQTVIITAAIDEYLSSLINIVPNPTQGQIRLTNRSAIPISKIEVYDLSGKYLNDIKYNLDQIDMSKYRPGLYFLKIKQNKATVIKQLLLMN